MGRSATHASDPRALRADAVYFATSHEPARLLILRLVQGGEAAEWFWPQATAISCSLPVEDRIERLLDRWRIQEAGWAGVARELLPALDAKTALAFVERMRPRAAARWLGGFAGGSNAAIITPLPAVRERVRGLLQQVRLRVRDRDPRALFLAVLAVLDSCPTAPQDAALPRIAAHVFDDDIARQLDERDARGRLATRRRATAVTRDHPAANSHDRSTSSSASADAPPEVDVASHQLARIEHRTEWAGLYFLLLPLRRLGIVAALEAHPGLAFTHFVARALLRVAVDAGVPEDDPVLRPLHEDVPEVDRDDLGGEQYGRRYDARLWSRAVRLWCRKYARMTVAEIVARPGRIYATPTSIDITMPMETVDVRVRRLGLDIDPGYVPWLARVVHFHYHHEV